MKPIKSSFHQASRKFFYLLKILGLACYTVDNNNLRIKTGISDYLMLIISIFIAIAFAWYKSETISVITGPSAVKSQLVNRLFDNQYLVQYYLIPLIIMFNFYKRKNVEKFARKILEHDKMAARLKFQFLSNKWEDIIAIIVIILPFFIITIYIAHVSIERYMNEPKELMKFSIAMYIFNLKADFFWALSLQFILSSRCVLKRLTALNESLR